MYVPAYMSSSNSVLSGCSSNTLQREEQPIQDALSVALQHIASEVIVVITDGLQPLLRQYWDLLDVQWRTDYHKVDASDPSEMERILDHNSDPNQASVLFLVMCSTACILNLLRQVNAHDSHYEEQGVLTYHHRWMVVTNTDLNTVERNVENITHLCVFKRGGSSMGGHLYAAMWEQTGRRLRLSARINNGRMSGEAFPTLRYGLNGRTFIVATNMWGPFVSRTVDDQGLIQFQGYCIDLLDTIATYMNFTYILTVPSDRKWGALINGTWNGLLGELVYKYADMMAAPSSRQTFREEVMDYSFPFYIEETAVIYKHTQNLQLKWFLVARPYRWQVWACMAALVPIVGLLMWYLLWALRKIHKGHDGTMDLTLLESILYRLGNVLNQGTTKLPKTSVARPVIIFWIFTCVVFSATYSGNLVALLTVEVEQVPFRSMQELATQQQYRIGILGDTAYVNIFQSGTGAYEIMWDKMQLWEDNGYDVISPSHGAHLDMVDKGNYAYFIDATAGYMHAQTSCELRLFWDDLFPLQYAFGFQNNSAYEIKVSKIIMRLSQTGIFAKWQNKYWPHLSGCEKKSSAGGGIGIHDVAGLFYITSGLLTMSGLIFVLEICKGQCQTPD